MRYNVHINNVGYNVHIIPWIYYNYPWRISNIFGHLSHEICSHGVPLICIMSKAYPTMHCWSSDQCLEGCKKTPDTGEMDGNGAKKPSTKSTRHSMVLFGASPHKSRIFLHRYIQIHPVVESRATWCLYIYICLYDFTDIAILETSWCFMVTFAGVNEDLKVSLKMFIFIDGCVWESENGVSVIPLNSHFLDNDENLLELGGTPFKTDD